MKQFVCLSGLPRTGSTLLSAILSQNPNIHAEGNSAVCQLMWDMSQSCTITSKEQLQATNRESTIHDIISQIPHIYYKNAKEPIVVDKCRSWTISANIDLLRKYVDANIKIIVLERPVIEIVKSFVKLYKDNKRELNLNALLAPQSEPIMRSIAGINWAKKNNQTNTFLFLSYQDLISNPKETIAKIYEFCGWEPFPHNYDHVLVKYPEDDSVYQLKGQHKIRPRVSKRIYDIDLPEPIVQQCTKIDQLMGYAKL
jgi:sulfotransferase